MKFEFERQNTILTAGASAFDRIGQPLIVNQVIASDDPENIAAVYLFAGNASATSKLSDSYDGFNPITSSLVDLDITAEPDPFVYDLAYATVSGSQNIRLSRIEDNGNGTASVPGPIPVLGIYVAYRCSKRMRRRVKENGDSCKALHFPLA